MAKRIPFGSLDNVVDSNNATSLTCNAAAKPKSDVKDKTQILNEMMTGIQLNQRNKNEHLPVLHSNNLDPYSQLEKELVDDAVILNQKLDLINNMDLTEFGRIEMGLSETRIRADTSI